MFGRRIGRWSVQGLHYVIGQHAQGERCKNVSFLCIAKFFVTTLFAVQPAAKTPSNRAKYYTDSYAVY